MVRALAHLVALAAAAFVLLVTLSPSSAEDQAIELVVPAPFTEAVNIKRDAYLGATQPKLTSAFLQAYVDREQKLKTFDAFDVPVAQPRLTEDLLMGYIARKQNLALDAIEKVDITDKPALTADVLSDYAAKEFVPTVKRVKLADGERLCLAQAIYHEARGESREGQLAVANVIINRAFSNKYPTTICGVVFQNADKGRYKCQFTFACDGRSDVGMERGAWNNSMKLADVAFHEFQMGERPGVIPNSALFYHTTKVNPDWSDRFRRVAAIGSHVFYAN